MNDLGYAHLKRDRAFLPRHVLLPCSPQPDALADLVRRDRLAQEYVRAQMGTLRADLCAAERRNHEHRRHLPLAVQRFEQHHAVHPRQRQLGDQQLRPQLAHRRERLVSVLRDADQLHVLGRFAERRHLCAEFLIAVRQQDTNFFTLVIHVINRFR